MKPYINLLLAVLLNGFIPATHITCSSSIVSNISGMKVSATYTIEEQKKEDRDIHPLDMLSLKFY